jgi:predicted aspartyl protease
MTDAFGLSQRSCGEIQIVGAVMLLHTGAMNFRTGLLLLPALVLACAAAAAVPATTSQASVAPDFPVDVTQVVVPFTLYAGHIYVDVTIDGKGPFHIVFDSGALNVLTPATARSLGLASSGKIEAHGTGGVQSASKTRVGSIRIGGVSLRDQIFYVVDLPSPANEGRPIDGLIGFEWLSQFPTRIDYAAATLTFYPRGGFRYAGAAAATRLRFRGRLPQVDGAVDGIAGRFTIDTGSNGSLSLYPAFVAKNGLVARYRATTEVLSAIGVGGPIYALQTRVGALSIAGQSVTRPVTFLARVRSGAAMDADTAGNIGSGVLRRFTLTLDYPRSLVYFEPNAAFAEPDLADRSGLRLEVVPAGFRIVYVVKDSAGMLAGLKADDVIVAIDGRPAAGSDITAFRSRLKGAAGTAIPIGMEGGRTATITLKEID